MQVLLSTSGPQLRRRHVSGPRQQGSNCGSSGFSLAAGGILWRIHFLSFGRHAISSAIPHSPGRRMARDSRSLTASRNVPTLRVTRVIVDRWGGPPLLAPVRLPTPNFKHICRVGKGRSPRKTSLFGTLIGLKMVSG